MLETIATRSNTASNRIQRLVEAETKLHAEAWGLLTGTTLISETMTLGQPAVIAPRLGKGTQPFLDEAEKTLRHAYDVCGQKLHVVHLRLARIFRKRGNRPRTTAELEEYLKKTPDAKNTQAIRDQEIEGAP